MKQVLDYNPSMTQRLDKKAISGWPLGGNQSGIALFIVLWVLTLLSVIVGEFCHTMRAEVNIARNYKEETESQYIAEAGVYRAIAELVKDKFYKPKKPTDSEDEEEDTEEEEVEWRVNIDIPAVPFGSGKFKVYIGNESGKVDLNRADKGLLKEALEGFDMESFDMEDNDKDIIVDSILDWRDTNNNHRINGAEKDYYNDLDEPYDCKNGDFDSVRELLLVRGVTPELFYGGLKKMFTVYYDGSSTGSRGNKKKGRSSSKININAAPAEILSSLFKLTDEQITDIIEYRKEEDFKNYSDLASVIGEDALSPMKNYITFSMKSYYSIRSVGMREGSQTRKGVDVMVELNRRLKKRFRVVRWFDDLEYPIDTSQGSEDEVEGG
ncbi:MAG: hypothetical protein GY864_12735 [Desulfobacterales bacterium]|nr:hypothetical protein [Desulfobacterales bacterium]